MPAPLSPWKRRSLWGVCALLPVMTVPLGSQGGPTRATQPELSSLTVPELRRDGLRFRDLDRDGSLSVFEDWRRSAADRARDLVRRLTIAEKAGLMMHGTARSVGSMSTVGVGDEYDSTANAELIQQRHLSSFITRLGGAPGALAHQHNRLQALAERTRFAIPLTISTDPRHHFQYVLGASVTEGQFSQWPETLGFGALQDTALTRRFGDIARQEYRAVGIHMALSPQADLATEPRWSRINATFGEQPALVNAQTRAYVEGFQHGRDGTSVDGVSTIVKHWVGYGASADGFDGHNHYGRFATFPGRRFDDHVSAFLGAFDAQVAGVMPTYPILQGIALNGAPIEAVGAGFNRQLIAGLLRGTHKFRGLVITDWAITNDCSTRCRDGVPAGERPSFADLGMPWGVESLPMRARFVKAVDAGVDQFGGTERSDLLVAAVDARELAESQLTASAERVLALKFAQGLFERPFVDTARATTIVGNADFRRQGFTMQGQSMVLLKRDMSRLAFPLIPLTGAPPRVYLYGVDSTVAKARGFVVTTDLSTANFAIVRLAAPFETLHPNYLFGSMQHEGSLEFRTGQTDFDAFMRISAALPTITSVYLDRPAIVTPLRDHSAVLLANFGATDDALLAVITGALKANGRLPFELPSSMEAVQAQLSDVPSDSRSPLYPFGFWLRY
jgi:beta-glucosidase